MAIFIQAIFPIVVEPHIKDAQPLYMGLAQYGGELISFITKLNAGSFW